ncbi:MAG: YsnF/AvaK domain-containing protein [Chloroflexota bacterium]|nr:YsnF/AvaK domain-containing protein [Chloroflexota bacterium]
MANERDTVVGIFLDQAHAQKAIQALKAAGFNAQMTDQSGLGKLGLNNDASDLYSSRASEGNSVVTVNASGRGDEAFDVMLQNGAENVNFAWNQQSGAMSGGASAASNTTRSAQEYKNMHANDRQYGQQGVNAEKMKVQLREETLTPVKQAVQAGEVELHKVVHEKQEQVPVTLTHEEVYIERTPVDRIANAGEITDMKDEVIRVPVYEEQAELQKQTRVREEVGIGKEAMQEQHTLSGTAKHEHLEVQQSGGVQIRGEGTTQGDTYETTTRTQQTTTETGNGGMTAYDSENKSGR